MTENESDLSGEHQMPISGPDRSPELLVRLIMSSIRSLYRYPSRRKTVGVGRDYYP
ncbi:hypothetical protein C9890_0135 [Perkinsus sp. BL_2016]|nr:hypothetical protein C9890_0135 [Perkinsus sp. BL_2016]